MVKSPARRRPSRSQPRRMSVRPMPARECERQRPATVCAIAAARGGPQRPPLTTTTSATTTTRCTAEAARAKAFIAATAPPSTWRGRSREKAAHTQARILIRTRSYTLTHTHTSWQPNGCGDLCVGRRASRVSHSVCLVPCPFRRIPTSLPPPATFSRTTPHDRRHTHTTSAAPSPRSLARLPHAHLCVRICAFLHAFVCVCMYVSE